MVFGGSLTDIALLMMVNVLFLSNYFFITKLRRLTDKVSLQNETNIFDELRRGLAANPLVAGIGGFLKSYKRSRDDESQQKAKKKGKVSEIVYAFFLGRVKMAPSIAKRFPGWEPIPFKLGIWTTSVTLLLATFLLSDYAFIGELAIDNSGNGGGFCSTKDATEKVNAFYATIRSSNITNIENGFKQYSETKRYRDALVKSTTRYGYDGNCNKPGTQTNWNNDPISNEIYTETLYHNDADTTDKYGDAFFPYYCAAAREHAATEGCTAQLKVCVDDWGLSVLCKTITQSVPCSPTWQGDNNEELQANETAIESDASVEDLDHLEQNSVDIVKTLLVQIDLAGTLYSVYMVVALFFPTPIVLFRPDMLVMLKKVFFGVGKYTFIVTVLVAYWGYEYIGKLLNMPEVQIFLNNLQTDPCFLDADFIRNRTQVVQNVCNELIDFENKIGIAQFEIKQTIQDVDTFNSNCGCPFPENAPFNADYEMQSDLNFMGFEDTWKVRVHSGGSDVTNEHLLQPKDDFQFIGNETICVDLAYAREKIMVADDTGLSWWELWISSGLLAGLVIKFFIANFGISLVKLADPFCIHDGKYESPPESMDHSEDDNPQSFLHVNRQITENKSAALKAIALRSSVVWGLLTNMCLASLVISSAPNINEFQNLDIIICSVISALCIIGAVGCYIFSKYASRVVENEMAEA